MDLHPVPDAKGKGTRRPRHTRCTLEKSHQHTIPTTHTRGRLLGEDGPPDLHKERHGTILLPGDAEEWASEIGMG